MKKASIFILIIMLVVSIFVAVAEVDIPSDLTIVIDAGHGGMDGGASIGDIKESDLTLSISKKIKEVFEKDSIKVIMTRETEEDLSNEEFVKREDMLKRVHIINSSKASLALSIHLNKFSMERYRGAQVFYSQTNTLNPFLAETMQRSLIHYLKNTERKIVKRDNIFLLNKVTIPCCIVECGFMSNREELNLLQTEEYQYKIAYALLYGVEDFLKLY